jgi:hypothetical protein
MPKGTDDTARARLQGKRVALGVVLVVSVAIIASSALQIIPTVFGVGIRPMPAAPAGTPARTCSEGIRNLERALDRAGAAAGSASFSDRLQPEWDRAPEIEHACDHSSEGIDAWAALVRLRLAQEQLSPHGGDELLPLRRDVIAHLPADLR